eukprot:COSAG04_NODE_612_length_11991_cov_17.359569_11_plen_34_part_00
MITVGNGVALYLLTAFRVCLVMAQSTGQAEILV